MAILETCELQSKCYHYLDETNTKLDFINLLNDLNEINNENNNNVVLFHMCGHNPTGVDPTEEQWMQIYNIVRNKHLLIIFDNAYQGYVSGDIDIDSLPVRLFISESIKDNYVLNMIVCCSFAKNFGLYSERVGCLHVITNNNNETQLIAAQLRALSRVSYSTCPSYGARIVAYVLSDPERKRRWKDECCG